jgi:hypothetical protein
VTGGFYARFASPADAPGGMAVNDQDLFWIDAAHVYSEPKGNPTGTFTTLASGLASATALALDSSTIWMTQNQGSLASTSAQVAGVPSPVAGANPSFGVAFDAANVYFTNHAAVFAVDKSSRKVTKVADCATTCTDVASDGTNLLWATLHEIWEAPVAAGVARRLASGQKQIAHFALYADHVYWTDAGAGEVWSTCE